MIWMIHRAREGRGFTAHRIDWIVTAALQTIYGMSGLYHYYTENDKHFSRIIFSDEMMFNEDMNNHNLVYFSDFTEAVAHRLAHEQAVNWSSCDSSSPAFLYMYEYINA